MGVSLGELVSSTEIDFDQLNGRRVAIDSYNIIYQFLSSIRDRMTGEPLRDSKGRITSHLSGLFHRTSRMLEAGIDPVFVFDGKPPDFKQETIAARQVVRDNATQKWKQAVREGDTDAVRRYSQQASRLTKDMVDDSKRLLGMMGVSWIQAPSEGEAQATHLMRQGKVWAVGSQDWDSLMFGAHRLVRNLTVSGRRKLPRKQTFVTVRPELVELEKVLEELGISHDQLIILGILVGTDYNKGGIMGIGPKKALKLVKEHKTLDKIIPQVSWEFQTPPEKIFDFFSNPPAHDLEIEKNEFDPEGLKSLLVEEHGFSEARVDSAIKIMTEAEERGKQSSLGKFF